MSESVDRDRYRPSSVIQALHFNKLGQYRSRRRSISIVVLFAALCIPIMTYLVQQAVVITPVAEPSGQLGSSQTEFRPPTNKAPSLIPLPVPLPADFPSGYIGKFTIVHDHQISPEFVYIPRQPGPEDPTQSYEWRDPGPDGIGLTDEVSVMYSDDDFGLPEETPMWMYTMRTLGSFGFPESGFSNGFIFTDVATSRPPHARLSNPSWPRKAEFFFDTAWVEGLITMHSYGTMTFDLTTESHPKLGFAREVERAVERSTCYPAIDENGRRISVRCRYRCVFARGSNPEVYVTNEGSASVDQSMTATVER